MFINNLGKQLRAMSSCTSPEQNGPMLQPIRVDWRLSVRDVTYKISDVVINGLSMAANGQRNGGRAPAILAVMREQTASASAR
jgi:hypothetical protein